MTKITDIKKRAVTGHCTEEDIRWLINEVEKLSILIKEKEKTIVELSKWSKESAEKYANDLVDRRVKELSIKWEADLEKVQEVLARSREELIRARDEAAESREEYARIEAILKDIMNIDTQLH